MCAYSFTGGASLQTRLKSSTHCLEELAKISFVREKSPIYTVSVISLVFLCKASVVAKHVGNQKRHTLCFSVFLRNSFETSVALIIS